jgi:Ala-tRNA(Pro) deacylase
MGTNISRVPATARGDAIVDFLDVARIGYDVLDHEPAMSATAEAKATGQRSDEVAKTVVLHDGSVYVIAAIPGSHRLDLHKLRETLGATRHLRLATEEEIARDFPLPKVGAIPTFGPMVPAAEVIDQRLLEQDRILCPAGDHTHSSWSILVMSCGSPQRRPRTFARTDELAGTNMFRRELVGVDEHQGAAMRLPSDDAPAGNPATEPWSHLRR